MIDRPAPLVPRTRRYTVRERLAVNGDVLVPLDEAAIPDLARKVREEKVGAVAIGFLHAYAHDAHERRVRDILRPLLDEDVTICISSEVAPEIREYRALLDDLRQCLCASADVGLSATGCAMTCAARLERRRCSS